MTSDESTSSHLSHELHQAINAVKSALNLTSTQNECLKEKFVIAKNQIQDDVSSHLELLRNREVWLLEQVNVHAQIKEETAESHINELCGLLAKLEVYQALLEAPELQESQVIATQAMNILSRITNEVLHSEEVLGICFSADNFALADAVKNFGKVVESAVPCEPARKVPRLHKKKFTSRSGSCRDLVFFQEHFQYVKSSPQKDWLIGGIQQRKESNFDSVWKYFEELKKSDNKEWLFKTNQPMDVEEVSNQFAVHFQQVKSTPAAEWLQSGVACEVGDNTREYTSLDTSENIKSWLLRPMESLSLSTKGEELIDEGISLSRQSSNVEQNDIADKYSGKNKWLIQDGVSPVDDDWILTSGDTNNQPQVTKSGSWLQRFRESSGTSSSDWLIVSETEPDYCEWLTQESIDRCKSCPGECAKDTFSVFRNVLKSSKSEWLATATDW